MSNTPHNALIICEFDYQRLISLTENSRSATAEALEDELDRADITSLVDFPSDAVCMDSDVTFTDLDSGEETTVSLVYPGDANVDQMKISVLSPVGSALIGLRIGGTIDWPLPGGKVRRLKVVAVTQPEKIRNAQ